MEFLPPTETDTAVRRVTERAVVDVADRLAAELPLGTLLRWPGLAEPFELVVTMRTPGDDEALAVGYLLGESLLDGEVEVVAVSQLPEPVAEAGQILVELSAQPPGLDLHRRAGYASSSCGLCGKASVNGVLARDLPELPEARGTWGPEFIRSLPAQLRAAQPVFGRTGGLHAAALFSPSTMKALAEDVGRHNAVDKVVGALHLRGETVAVDDLLVVSSRAGFEIVQKARMAGISAMAAIGAPSSLAVSLAEGSGMTLIGFLRADGFNIYSGAERVSAPTASSSTEGARPWKASVR